MIFPKSAYFPWGEKLNLHPLCYLIKNSLKVLKTNGEVRINGHAQRREDMKITKKWLSVNYPNSRLTCNPFLIVIEK